MNLKNKSAIIIGCLLFFCNDLAISKKTLPFKKNSKIKKMRDALGKMSISVELYDYILNNVSKGKAILELGSGFGTHMLSKFYKMYSIENDTRWLNKFNSTYIYAPIVNYGSYSWYNIEILKKKLNFEYSLILVDGPSGKIGRCGFFYNHHLFNINVILILDDVQRQEELQMIKDLSAKYNAEYEIIKCQDGKSFGVINMQKK